MKPPSLRRRHSYPPLQDAQYDPMFSTGFGNHGNHIATDFSFTSSASPMESSRFPSPRPTCCPFHATMTSHHLSLEPIILQLTKENLAYHTAHLAMWDDRHRHIDAYVTSQADILRMDECLQCCLREEKRRLIPIDTPTLRDQVIVERPWPPIFTCPTKQHELRRVKSSCTRLKRWLKRVFFGTKKEAPLPSSDATTMAPNTPLTEKITSKDQVSYPMAMIEHGLCGLGNPNLAQALAGPNHSFASIAFSPDVRLPVADMENGPLPPSPAHPIPSDIYVTPPVQLFPRPSPTPYTSKRKKKMKDNVLITTRYPRMVHVNILRQVAIRILSQRLIQATCSCPSHAPSISRASLNAFGLHTCACHRSMPQPV